MSLSNFSKNYTKQEFHKEKVEEFKNNENIKVQEELLKEKYDQLKDKDESQLMSELLSEVSKQKQNGSFDYNNLKSTVDSLGGFLSEEQKSKIDNILESIK